MVCSRAFFLTVVDRFVRSAPPRRAAQEEPSSAEGAAAAPRVATQRAPQWRPIVVQATLMWAATRIALLMLSYLAVVMSTSGYDTGYIAHSLHSLLDNWDRWDAMWYTSIAAKGYWTDQAFAFFPLYPLLIKAVTLVIGPRWLLAAMVVANLGALVAFIGIALLAVQEIGTTDGAWRSIALLASYPLAFFLAAPYTEPLFLGWAALSLLTMRRGSWRWAALWTFLAVLTRPTGVILLPALLWEYGRQHGWWTRATLEALRAYYHTGAGWLTCKRVAHLIRDPAAWDFVLALASGPVAIGLFALYCRITRGHFLIFLHAQAFWHRTQEPIWTTLVQCVQLVFALPPLSFWQMRLLVDLLPVLAFGAITLICIRRQPVAFTLYMLGLIYLTVATPVTQRLEPDPLFSAGRFLLVAAPMFVLFARWTATRPWLQLLLVSTGFMAQAILGVFFLTGGWMV